MRKMIAGVCLAVLIGTAGAVAYRMGRQVNAAKYDDTTGAVTANWPTYQGRPAAEYFGGRWNCPKGWEVFGIESRPSDDFRPDAVCVKD